MHTIPLRLLACLTLAAVLLAAPTAFAQGPTSVPGFNWFQDALAWVQSLWLGDAPDARRTVGQKKGLQVDPDRQPMQGRRGFEIDPFGQPVSPPSPEGDVGQPAPLPPGDAGCGLEPDGCLD